MRARWIFIALVVSLAVNAALGGMLLGSRPARSTRDTGPAARGEAASRGWRDSYLSRRLELDAVQVEALDALHLDLGRALAPSRLELNEKRRELIALMRQPEADRARLSEVFRRMGDLQATVEQAYAMNFLEVKRVLTSEQQELYFELLLQKLSSRNGYSREINSSKTEQ